MTDTKQREQQRSHERLLLTCLIIERLCADRVPASLRLEAKIGAANTHSLVVPRRRLLATSGRLNRHPSDAARVVAAA
jgi:hypothetical protein